MSLVKTGIIGSIAGAILLTGIVSTGDVGKKAEDRGIHVGSIEAKAATKTHVTRFTKISNADINRYMSNNQSSTGGSYTTRGASTFGKYKIYFKAGYAVNKSKNNTVTVNTNKTTVQGVQIKKGKFYSFSGQVLHGKYIMRDAKNQREQVYVINKGRVISYSNMKYSPGGVG